MFAIELQIEIAASLVAPLWDLCAALGNPRTTKAEYVKAMYLIYKHRKGEKL